MNWGQFGFGRGGPKLERHRPSGPYLSLPDGSEVMVLEQGGTISFLDNRPPGSKLTIIVAAAATFVGSARLAMSTLGVLPGDILDFVADDNMIWRLRNYKAAAGGFTIISSGAQTLTAADSGSTFLYTVATTVTMADSTTLPAGWNIKVINGSAGMITFNRAGADVVRSKATDLTVFNLPGRNDSGELVLDKTNARYYWRGVRTFVSADSVATVNLLTSNNHNLGVIPDFWGCVLVCVVNTINYVVGDVVDPSTFASAAAAAGYNTLADATVVNTHMGPQGPAIANKTTFATTVITAASWNIRQTAAVYN